MKIGPNYHRGSTERAFDLGIVSIFAVPALTLSSISASALALEMKRRPLFIQDRINSESNHVIKVPKLVTLTGPITNEPSNEGYVNNRATKIGAVVRRLHIDESPQLLLVASGKMSIVGPRPLVPIEHEEIMDILSPGEQLEYSDALKICKPGIVAPGSYHIHRGRVIDPLERVEATVNYAYNGSIASDMQELGLLSYYVMADYLPKLGQKSD